MWAEQPLDDLPVSGPWRAGPHHSREGAQPELLLVVRQSTRTKTTAMTMDNRIGCMLGRAANCRLLLACQVGP